MGSRLCRYCLNRLGKHVFMIDFHFKPFSFSNCKCTCGVLLMNVTFHYQVWLLIWIFQSYPDFTLNDCNLIYETNEYYIEKEIYFQLLFYFLFQIFHVYLYVCLVFEFFPHILSIKIKYVETMRP